MEPLEGDLVRLLCTAPSDGAEHVFHVFHRDCLEKWLAAEGPRFKCPLCNKTVVEYDGATGLRETKVADEVAAWLVQPVVAVELPGGRGRHSERTGADNVRRVRVRHPDGGVRNYEGAQGDERLVRIDHEDGSVWHYEGARHRERLVTKQYADAVEHYADEHPNERLVRVVFPDGTVEHFEGEPRRERHVTSVFPDGQRQSYAGEKDEERLVEAVFPDGSVRHYVGEPHRERLVTALFADGQRQSYEGETNEERLVEVVFPDGSVRRRKGASRGGPSGAARADSGSRRVRRAAREQRVPS